MSDAATLDLKETPNVTRKEVVTHDHAPMARVDEADPMISMIERIVMDPSVPIERLERMLALKERMEDRAREDEARQAKRDYFAAMAACQAELPIIARNRENDHTKSRYADLTAIVAQAMPVINKHGFSPSFWPGGYNEQGQQLINWRIAHTGGHEESGIGEIPIDKAGSQGKANKTDTQAFGSTTTYGRRYMLCMLFNISTGDDIDGNEVGGTINDEQLGELERFIEAHDAEPSKILQRANVSSLEDIAAKDFPALMQALKQWANKQRGAA